MHTCSQTQSHFTGGHTPSKARRSGLGLWRQEATAVACQGPPNECGKSEGWFLELSMSMKENQNLTIWIKFIFGALRSDCIETYQQSCTLSMLKLNSPTFTIHKYSSSSLTTYFLIFSFMYFIYSNQNKDQGTQFLHCLLQIEKRMPNKPPKHSFKCVCHSCYDCCPSLICNQLT